MMDDKLHYGDVSRAVFAATMERSIHLKECARCGWLGGEILVRMPYYGRFGAVVKCPHCGAETKIQGITITMFSGKRMGTPVIEESLMDGIKNAVRLWNDGEVS